MAHIAYTLQRNVPAKNGAGHDCLIALALVVHENGVQQTVAIDEAMIRFAGEGVIESEVRRAAAMPSDASIGNPLNIRQT